MVEVPPVESFQIGGGGNSFRGYFYPGGFYIFGTVFKRENTVANIGEVVFKVLGVVVCRFNAL